MTQIKEDENSNILTASYLFCRHLEQNGLYDYKSTEDAYNFNPEESKGTLRRCRELEKVFVRSGASTVLDVDRAYKINLIELLEGLNIIWREGNDIALMTGYWRHKLAQEFGYEPIFKEGHYSVPYKYIPSTDLEIENFISYINNDYELNNQESQLVNYAENLIKSSSVENDVYLDYMQEYTDFENAVEYGLTARTVWLSRNDYITNEEAIRILDVSENEFNKYLDIYDSKEGSIQ